MKFLEKFERKFSRYAIPNLIKYILGLFVLGTFLDMIRPGFYGQYLSLDFSMVAKGQIWRLLTFIMAPYGVSKGSGMIVSLFFLLIQVSLYYMIGNALEQAWGSFRFNLYVLSGILFNVIAALILYLAYKNLYGVAVPYANITVSGVGYIGLDYIFQSMFLAFAFLFPDVQVLFMMVIPLKIKWLGYLYGALLAFNIVSDFAQGAYILGTAMLVSMANFLLFAFWSWKVKRPTGAQMRRKRQFQKQVRKAATKAGEPRHRCAICGRTELDDPNLEFRFCSKCEGNYEYCSDHLFTHEHVKRK